MNNQITLYTIGEILGKNFFIPSFQRGFRWTEQNVKDLLNDIDSFNPEKNQATNKESWYCLQPLVVRKMNKDEIGKIPFSEEDKQQKISEQDWYEVVDGQQRITTILLFIHYFNEMWVGKQKVKEPIIKYETRENGYEFLKKLEIDTNSNCVIITDKANYKENIDFFHISRAYNTIHDWFKIKDHGFDNNKFQSKFKSSTQVIWYEINDNDNPVDTFIRINMGKIPLTNSELIKALFLQKRNFDEENAELRQIEISNEWDRMEYTFQNEDFWWFLNKDKNDMSARIEFLFDIICLVEKKKNINLGKTIGADIYATFRFFNERFSSKVNFEVVEKEWNIVKDYFLAFDEWFNEPVWYHYIGYLIFCGTSIVDIYSLYKDSAKNMFLDKLKELIKEKLKSINIEKRVLQDNKTQYDIGLIYKGNTERLREFLLLFNIEYIVKQYNATKEKEDNEIFIRFPFELFKKESWDIEHIDSFTENQITNNKEQLEWLKNSKEDLINRLDYLKKLFSKDLEKTEEERKSMLEDMEKNTNKICSEIDAFIKSKKDSKQFMELRAEIIRLFGEDKNSDDVKKSIGNLTLLDAEINRGYKNALFPTKRRIIIEKDTAGKFIPICTKNVFLKYFDKKGTTRTKWTGEDIANYQNHIGSILDEFLTFKQANNNE